MANGILHAVKQVRGGVRVSHNKNTKDMPVERIAAPKQVVLPMQQHIGAPCQPIVKVGDTVEVGQKIGDSDAFVSAPIHSSVSGTVSAIKEIKTATGMPVTAVFIDNDGEMRLHESVKPPVINSREDFLKAIRESGLVGLGGAGFPTHVKLSFKPDAGIDTLVINAAECEPYITVDYRECIDNSRNILAGVYELQKYFGFEQVVIAVEDNKPDAIKILNEIAHDERDIGDKVKVMTLKSKYPQGAEKMMVQSATGRKVPPGKLPADVGCVVMNVGSVGFIGRFIRTGRPLVSRSLTVDGSAIANPKNVRVPVGTSLQDIIDFCGGFKEEPAKIITGGPMMGVSVIGTEYPVLKQNNAILAFTKKENVYKKERDCIRCGRCANVCPMSLMPTLIDRFAMARDVESLKNTGVMVCMECGSCAYSCPAGKPLVQSMREAKHLLREEANKK